MTAPALSLGAHVLTVRLPDPSRDWSLIAEMGRRFGVEGTIVDSSDSHGEVFKVRHDDGTIGWYEPRELTPSHRVTGGGQ